MIFDRNLLKFFLLVAKPTRILDGMEDQHLATFKEDHLRIIPVKFGEIPPCGSEMLFEGIVDRGRTSYSL